MNFNKLFLGAEKPNKTQLKALSGLFIKLGLLIVGSVVIKFFLPEEKISILVLISSSLLTMAFFIWGIRLLREVKDNDE